MAFLDVFKKKGEVAPVQPQNETVVFVQKIGKEQITKANQTLIEYKRGKINLEQRIIENENWWKLQHWKEMKDTGTKSKPSSAWLFNTIISKHADLMEAYPTFNCLPREEGDKEEAQSLSSIIPVILEQNHFEDTYSDCGWQKLKGGTGVYGIFWDNTKLNGLGDISIEKVDLLSLFWKPGISDIQDSPNFFRTILVDNETIEGMYPETVGHLGNNYLQEKYEYDDEVDTSEMSLIVDWYYKKQVGNKKVLHYVRYVGDVVLYATENMPEMAERGLYDHGLYPFEFDVLFPVEGSPCGFSYVDICKNPQQYIDELGGAFLDNAKWNSRPRYFSRDESAVNEEEFANTNKMFVRTDSGLGENDLREIKVNPLSNVYLEIRNHLIDEMKETSGNRDVNNGGSAAGVTAASAIAAMQEQSGKTSRDSSQNSYRSYERIINMCIELIRQFYDIPRQFRIKGKYGNTEFVKYSNKGIKPQNQGDAFGIDLGFRLPVFDLKISSQKANAYTKLSQNELALQFYNLGFFNPQMTDQALMTIDMMDFDNKDMISNKISEQGTLHNKLIQTQQICLALCEKLDTLNGTNLAEQFAMAIMQNTENTTVAHSSIPSLDIDKENKIVSDARAQAKASTQPV